LTDALQSLILKRKDDVYTGTDRSYSGLPLPDYCGFAAEREGGGFGWRVWRHGLADGIWPARFSDVAVEGNDDIGGAFHDYIAVAFDYGDPQRRFGYNGFGIGAGEECACASSAEAGSAANWHTGTDSVGTAAVESGSGSSCQEVGVAAKRMWRNWQTHKLEVLSNCENKDGVCLIC